jgi:hypothetical protein
MPPKAPDPLLDVDSSRARAPDSRERVGSASAAPETQKAPPSAAYGVAGSREGLGVAVSAFESQALVRWSGEVRCALDLLDRQVGLIAPEVG